MWEWLASRAQTLDLLPQYLKGVYNAWHDYLWTALFLAPIIICWMIGGVVNPPEWLVVTDIHMVVNGCRVLHLAEGPSEICSQTETGATGL